MVSDNNSIFNNLLAGACAGAIADAVTHPLSTIKTRLQCQGALGASQVQSAKPIMYSGAISGLKLIVTQEGYVV